VQQVLWNIANMYNLLYFNTIFDPRYKLRYIKWIFNNDMNDDKSVFAKELLGTIRESINKLYLLIYENP